MPPSGIALYGAPASGKDTITEALSELDSRYVHFRRLKAGGGRTEGYRLCTLTEMEDLRNRGLIVYENARYDSLYAIDRPALDGLFARDLVPVVHLGQLEGVRALARYPALWLPVLLHCRRDTAEQRARGRGSKDITARLRAWDATERELARARPDDFALRIDTDRTSPGNAAQMIDAHLRRMWGSGLSASRR
jgi:guanylate kinase